MKIFNKIKTNFDYNKYGNHTVLDVSLDNERYYICRWKKPNDVHEYTEIIYATDFADALDTVIKIISRETGQSYDYCCSCILSLEVIYETANVRVY